MPEKFDAIVVGAGPSGNAATYTLAKAGLKVLQIERGEPCLLIRRRTWSGRQPVTAARLIHPGSRHRLEGRFSK